MLTHGHKLIPRCHHVISPWHRSPFLPPHPRPIVPAPPQDNAELFADEVEKEVQQQREAERMRMAAVPGLIPQAMLPLEEMADA